MDLSFNDFPNFMEEFDSNNLNFMDFPPIEIEQSPMIFNLHNDGDLTDSVFKDISEMLMHDNISENSYRPYDSLAIQAAEKSLYEVIGEKYVPSPPPPLQVEIPENISSDYSNSNSSDNSHSSNSCVNLVSHVNNPSVEFNGLLDRNAFSESDSVSLFKRGFEEASKFLPPKKNLSSFDLESRKGLKNRAREDVEEGRSVKHAETNVEEEDIIELFDRVLLCRDGEKKILKNGQLGESEVVRSRSKKRGDKKEVVDLRALLILCAQAVCANDKRNADGLLGEIRQYSSPFGDGSQRVSHYFADALEARLAGTGAQIYTSLASKKTSATDVLKSYQFYLSACPFKKFAIHFLNHHIFNLAQKAKTIHVIDFGIKYGFQWPAFIQCLSNIPGGPPKLRITGIELPQPGFRPAQRLEETGRRLAIFCERFRVQYEFNAIAQKFETIRIEDFKLAENESIAVNSLYRLESLPDETVAPSNPRDAVLEMIRKINPDVFTHTGLNGAYGAPYFMTRFKELLFHFSALFDMFDANLSRENRERMNFEKVFYGREVMNVVACEGFERVVRPETYKQWHARIARAGFKQVSIDRKIVKKMRDMAKGFYHRDFLVDEDGECMLQGWKGRIINASSCWVPV